MTQTQQKLTVEVSKVINAPVERVFKAWTDPEQLKKWLGGNMINSMTVQQDLRAGGKYKIDSIKADGTTGLITGAYQEIVPNKKLVFSWDNNSEEFPAKDTLVTVEFASRGKSTEVTIKHTKFVAQATAEKHNMGWTASLEKLAAILS
jgi:uncharacterized protein YndB with AHSA1/START domain